MSLVAIVGRPNVGKSTLFNRILGRRQAIVEDVPGVTRDRNYGAASWSGKEFTLVDTGGLDPLAEEGLFSLTKKQALLAVEQADVLLLVLDTKTGATSVDQEVADLLRKSHKPVLVAANKAEGKGGELEASAFFRLGMGNVYPLSALHGSGVAELLDALVEILPEKDPVLEKEHHIRVAVIGRPNTGKSTLVNRLLGEERVLVSDIPGTTADAVDIILEREGKGYLLIDTAGVRKKSRVSKGMEHYSVLRTLGAVERCDVSLLLLSSDEGLVDQDLKIAGLVHDRGKGLVVCMNKWDLVDKDHRTFDGLVRDIREKMFFFAHAPILSISALTGQRVERIFEAIEEVFGEAGRKIPTGQLNEAIRQAAERFQPPVVRGSRIRFFYATQVGVHPPSFVIFTSRPGDIRENYIRYLERFLRETFGFQGTPVRLFFRRGREEKGRKKKE
ncbi:MAG: ribosome biogenesis GTPase Der [Proteobacteria bacterium]|nr:ribosome biogenesis GTPase Der [Pseudomonadota bacterium]